jgi:short-subunit dehydrogenase
MGNNQTLMRARKNHFQPGSVVLVQGASSGLGKEIAKLYACRGCSMVLTGRNEKALQKLVEEIKNSLGNFNVHYVLGDATREEDAKNIVDFTLRHFGRIDIAVLAAGLGGHQDFDENVDLTAFRQMMEVNLFGYVNMTKYLLPHLKLTRGQLVVISSMSGVVPT